MPGETSPLLAGLCPGNYNVEVTDANGCVATLPVDVTISEPVPVTASITSANVSCFGLCDGTISLAISGGVAPYVVNWYDAATGTLIGISDADATGLCAGTYFAVVADNNGCTFTTPNVEITEPIELTFTLSTTDASCDGFCDGTGTIVIAGGTPPYTYEWLTISGDPIVGGTTPSVEDLCEGNYTVEVTDANGCTTEQQPFVINGFEPITATLFSNDADCGVSNGNATVFASGGNAPYTYQWFDVTLTPIAGETDMVLLDFSSGIYFVIVTDANGCSETFAVTISDIGGPDVSFDTITNPTCFGSCDGSIEITITGDNPPFLFSWNPDGIIAEDPTDLCAGDYLLEVIDDLGCTAYYDTTLVNPPEINIAFTISPTACGLCDGSINLTLTGGTGDLTVVWNNGEDGTSISDLCSGAYEATVTDENGCSVTQSFVVPNSEDLTIDASITAVSCIENCDGAIEVNGLGGTAPYTYLWLHDGSVSNIITDLCTGVYFVEVTDAAGCINTIEVELPEINPIEAISTVVNPTCGDSNGSIVVSSSGGVLPHDYLWNTGPTVSNISGLDAGFYTLSITDANGCSADFNYPLSNMTAAAIELEATDVNCFGDCNGEIDTTSLTGGTPTFDFEWLDQTGASIGITTPLATGLCAGDYTLQVTDAVGCISFQTTTISSPDTILVNPLFASSPLCNSDCDGLLIANPIGGTLPFSFSWDDPANQTTQAATGLCGGTYTVTMTDANGCEVIQTETIIIPDELTVSIDSVTDATCADAAIGEIFITTTGGNPEYSYEWTTTSSTDTLRDEDLTGLLPLTYFLRVIDANGCEYFDTVSVDTLVKVIADAGLDTAICSDSPISLIGTSNIDAGAVYNWLSIDGDVLSDSSEVVINGANDSTTLYVLEVSFMGCVDYDTVAITTFDAVAVDAGPPIDILPSQTEVIGGSPTTGPGNEIVWSPPIYLSDTTVSNPSVIEPEMSGWYYVTVTDENGCIGIDSVFVTVLPELVIPDGISPNGDGKNDTWILDFIEQYPGVSIKINIYSRWGELLYVADETYNDDWEGLTDKGDRLPAGTYYFVIDVDHEDFPDPITGPITVMW